MSVPLLDIVVPTYNRYDLLREFFNRNRDLESQDVHIWLVDDNSLLVDNFAIPAWRNISFIRLPKNRGQAYARNIATKHASSEFIVSLDDDAWFEDGTHITKQIARVFKEYPDAGCIMFNIATPSSPYSSLPTGTLLKFHITCGCAYRRDLLTRIGGFSGFLHSGAEETDVSLRIYKAGRTIRFCSEIKVFHNFSPRSRSLRWHFETRYNTVRNDLLIVLMLYPALVVPLFITGKFLSHMIFALCYNFEVGGTLWITCKAFVGFLRKSPEALRNRAPLSLDQFAYWKNLN